MGNVLTWSANMNLSQQLNGQPVPRLQGLLGATSGGQCSLVAPVQ